MVADALPKTITRAHKPRIAQVLAVLSGAAAMHIHSGFVAASKIGEREAVRPKLVFMALRKWGSINVGCQT